MHNQTKQALAALTIASVFQFIVTMSLLVMDGIELLGVFGVPFTGLVIGLVMGAYYLVPKPKHK